MNNHLYILEGKTPVPVSDAIEWATWYEKGDRIVKQTQVSTDVRISTVFLGINHNYFGGPPILFETMIFGGEHDDFQERYSTWEQAEEGHEAAIKMIFEIKQNQ